MWMMNVWMASYTINMNKSDLFELKLLTAERLQYHVNPNLTWNQQLKWALPKYTDPIVLLNRWAGGGGAGCRMEDSGGKWARSGLRLPPSERHSWANSAGGVGPCGSRPRSSSFRPWVGTSEPGNWWCVCAVFFSSSEHMGSNSGVFFSSEPSISRKAYLHVNSV